VNRIVFVVQRGDRPPEEPQRILRTRLPAPGAGSSLGSVKTFREGELVTVTRDDEVLDGIVSHVESMVKVVVAVPDEERGAILRTVHPRTLGERGEDGLDDNALRRVIQKSSAGRGGRRGGQGPRRGFGGTTGHRTTGK